MRVLKYGMVGDDVKAVQGLLAAKGYFKGEIRGNFLTQTKAAVIKFQKKEGLEADGEVGRLTYNALTAGGPTETKADPKQTTGKKAVHTRLTAELIDLCLADVGEREEWGNNRGKMEDAINKAIGSGEKSGAPYCIAGIVVRGLMVLASRYKLTLPKGMKTAGTQAFYNSAQKAGFVSPKGTKAKAGMVGIMQNKSAKSKGHAYLLTADEDSKGNHETMEYNTNVAGSRDGDGTYRSKRSQKGTSTKTYRGAVDAIAWLMSENPNTLELT